VNLILYIDNHPIKKFQIVPQESFSAAFLQAGSLSPSDSNIVEISIPSGKHTYIIYFPQPCPGGAAVYFPDREIVSDKELDLRHSMVSGTSVKGVASQKSYIERFAVEEEKKNEKSYGLGLRLGYIMGTDYISTMFFGGDLTFVLPILRRSISLFLEGGYYSQDKKESFNGTPVSWTLKVIPLTLNARCTYPFSSPILPYAGAGGGYFISSMDYEQDNGPKFTKNGSAPGIQAFIGAEANAGIGEAFIEARIFSSNFINKDADLEGGVGQYSLNLGWRFLY
jgi:opacity protein-like surface antigen